MEKDGASNIIYSSASLDSKRCLVIVLVLQYYICGETYLQISK